MIRYIQKYNRLDSICQTLNERVTKWTANITFIVDTKGRIEITAIKADTTINQLFVAELRRLFEHSPKWMPEKYHGRPVRSYRTQPVTFEPDEKPIKKSDGSEE